MKSFNVALSLCIVVADVAFAVPTWPSPATDELEDVLYLLGGSESRGFADFVTPCSFSAHGNGRITAAEWIRVAYHDMSTANVVAGTGGLDASIMYEVERSENIGAAFNSTLENLLGYYSPRASMADLLAMSVTTATRSCDGPNIPFKAGRIDAAEAGPTGVPLPEDTFHNLITKFEAQGFNQSEMVGLVACGHTLGGVHGENFPTLVLGNGENGNRFSHFDTTSASFDSQICAGYVAGTTKDPLVNGPDSGKLSDNRVFTVDHNTMVEMADNDVFKSTCQSLMGRMIDTVPSSVVLTEPLKPYEVKPSNLQLEVSADGTTLDFSGLIRVRTTNRPATDISSVQLVYTDRNGTIVTEAINAPSVSSATGFDEQFQFYKFSQTLPSSSSISDFTVSITSTNGAVETHNNNGASFPVNDSVMLQVGSSCMHVDATSGKSYMKIVAAVDTLLAGQDMTVSTTVPVPRQGLMVPSLRTFSTPMVLLNTTCDYLLYTANVPLSSVQSVGTYFDVISGEGDDAVIDSFKSVKILPTC